MRLLIIDPIGSGLDIASRALKDGHKVKLFIPQTDKLKYIGRGLVDVIGEFEPWVRWADLIVNTDNTKYVKALDRIRKDGPCVISATEQSAALELDRAIGMDAFKTARIPVPPVKEFSDYDKAVNFVKKNMKRYVSKPSGDADKALSYVAKSPADLVYMLERWKKNKKLKGGFILQEFIPGVEMAVGGWLGPNGFLPAWCENFEFKKLMNDDKGVATGEQGTVLRYVKSSKLADKVLKPLEDILVSTGHTGYVDVNCIIGEDGTPWPLEFTTRFGWPTFSIQMALHEGDCVDWLEDLAEGENECDTFVYDDVAVGVVLSIPDYPYSTITRKDVVGVPIYGIDSRNVHHIHFCEMMMGDAPNEVEGKIVSCPTPMTAGDYVLVMTSTGKSVKSAAQKAYNRLERLTISNSPMWRTDIGDRLSKQLPVIQAHGYAKGMKYRITEKF